MTCSQITIIGGGGWGTALSILAARKGLEVKLWVYEPEVVRAINEHRENPVFLPGFHVPSNVAATNSMQEALADAGLIVIAVPSHVCRRVYGQMLPFLNPRMIFVSATKGIETETQMRVSEVLREVLGEHFEPRLVALSGPSFAAEVARGDPTAVVAASFNNEYAQLIQSLFSSSVFRVYTSADVAGVELGGAVKNVMAIAAGVVVGLGWGSNSVAALLTRGLAEMSRLAVALGARAETMTGLAGLGDLVLTCTGALSRNRHVGIELGKGRMLAEILAETPMVAEGVNTTKATYQLSQRLGIEMPITASVYAMLYEGKNPRETAFELMGRPLKREI